LSSGFQLDKYFNPLQETNYASAETYFEEPLNDQQNPIADLHRESINEGQQVFVRKLGNFRYILIPGIINMFMTNISDPVREKHVLVFKLNLK
jgi:hypothetical protein